MTSFDSHRNVEKSLGGEKVPDRFSYVKRGYNPGEVDLYIDKMESVITSYKEKDSAIKNAIVSAQLAADNIIKNAENQARNMRSDAFQQLENISNSVNKQRKMLQDFQLEYNALIKKYITDFNEDDLQKVYDKIDYLEEYMNKIRNSENDDSE